MFFLEILFLLGSIGWLFEPVLEPVGFKVHMHFQTKNVN